MSDENPPQNDQNPEVVEPPKGESLDAILSGYARGRELLESLATLEEEKAPKKGKVAFFITRALMYLFVGQMALLTLLYVGLVIFTAADKDLLQQTTNVVIDGITNIVPFTTTFLGVAIGFYFREEVKSESSDEA